MEVVRANGLDRLRTRRRRPAAGVRSRRGAGQPRVAPADALATSRSWPGTSAQSSDVPGDSRCRYAECLATLIDALALGAAHVRPLLGRNLVSLPPASRRRLAGGGRRRAAGVRAAGRQRIGSRSRAACKRGAGASGRCCARPPSGGRLPAASGARPSTSCPPTRRPGAHLRDAGYQPAYRYFRMQMDLADAPSRRAEVPVRTFVRGETTEQCTS